MSRKDLPPVPPAGRSNRRPDAATADAAASDLASDAGESRRRNVAKQGRQGNIASNTKNQGYQQDR